MSREDGLRTHDHLGDHAFRQPLIAKKDLRPLAKETFPETPGPSVSTSDMMSRESVSSVP